jgi:hypothetical protein
MYLVCQSPMAAGWHGWDAYMHVCTCVATYSNLAARCAGWRNGQWRSRDGGDGMTTGARASAPHVSGDKTYVVHPGGAQLQFATHRSPAAGLVPSRPPPRRVTHTHTHTRSCAAPTGPAQLPPLPPTLSIASPSTPSVIYYSSRPPSLQPPSSYLKQTNYSDRILLYILVTLPHRHP